MGTISDKLTYLNTTKTKIREGLNSLGADLDTEDTFRSYADAIEGIYEDYPKITGEGESLSLDNTKQASMQIDYKGNTSQNGTPTPSSPIPINVVSGDNYIDICGKNYLDLSLFNNTEFYTISGNNVISNKSDNRSWSSMPYIILEAGTYTIISKNTMKRVQIGNISTTSVIVNGNSVSYQQFTLNETTKVGIKLFGVSTDTYPITYEEPMLLKGAYTTYPTTYEPYIGNSYPLYLGGNVFKLSDIEENKAIVGATGGINNSSVSNVSGYIPVVESLQYRLTFDYVTLLNSTDRGICYFDKNKQYISGGNLPMTNKNQLITIPSGIRYVRFSYDKNLTNINFTTDTTPIELCKIGNYQDYFGKSDGRNLFDKSKETINTIVNSAGTLSPNNDYNSSDYIVVNPSESVVLSTNTTSAILEIVEYDENKALVNRGVKTNSNVYTLTTNASTRFVRISYQNTSTKTQFEKGNTPTTWQPYGVGKWYLHKEIGKVVLNGSESWSYGTSGGYPRCTLNSLQQIKGYSDTNRHIGYFICSHFTPNTTDKTGHMYQYQRTILCNPTSDITSVELFKAWLSTNLPSLYFVLATPTNNEITDTTLLGQLEESKLSYISQTNISQVNNDLPIILDVKALRGE